MPPLIYVLLFDVEAALCHRLRLFVSMVNDIQIVGEIATPQQLSQACLALKPHVILLGSNLAPFVFDLSALIAQVSPASKIIALLNVHDPVRAQALLNMRLHGCVFQHEIDETVVHGLRLVAQGSTWCSFPMLKHLFKAGLPSDSAHEPKAPAPQNPLTLREQAVLRLLAQGLSNKATARELNLTEGTIEQHLKRIYRKLNVNSRSEATVWFLRSQG